MGAVIRTVSVRARLRAKAREGALAVHQALVEAANVALLVAKARAPGRIPDTLAVRIINQYAVRVASSWKGATWHENGSRAHPIAPKGAKVLAWSQNGSTRFARRVQHPGTKALHFMADGALAGRLAIRARMREIFR